MKGSLPLGLLLWLGARAVLAEESGAGNEAQLAPLLAALREQPMVVLSLKYASFGQARRMDAMGIMVPNAALEGSGRMDLANGRLSFEITRLVDFHAEDGPVASTGHVTFDGKEWNYVRDPADSASPPLRGLSSQPMEPVGHQVSKSLGGIFAEDPSPLPFALFPALAHWRVDEAFKPFSALVAKPAGLNIQHDGDLLSVSWKAGPWTNTYTFDAARGYALDSTYLHYEGRSGGSAALWLKVNSYQQVAGRWFPETAECWRYYGNARPVFRQSYQVTVTEVLAAGGDAKP